MSKKNKLQKAVKLEDKKNNKTKSNKVSGLIGMLELFVVLSVSYAIFIVATGLDDYTSKVLIIPAGVWVVVKLVQRFVR